MGEQADLIVRGEVCQACGEFFDEPLGYPGDCERCLRTEGRWIDDLGTSRRTGGDRTAEREARRRAALSDFDQAKALAETKGLVLKRFTDQHYQLTDGKWLQNIYPGNQRLYWDRNHAKPPFLKVPMPWTLLDVVEASKPCKK